MKKKIKFWLHFHQNKQTKKTKHCIGGSDQNLTQEKEMLKGKMVV